MSPRDGIHPLPVPHPRLFLPAPAMRNAFKPIFRSSSQSSATSNKALIFGRSYKFREVGIFEIYLWWIMWPSIPWSHDVRDSIASSASRRVAVRLSEHDVPSGSIVIQRSVRFHFHASDIVPGGGYQWLAFSRRVAATVPLVPHSLSLWRLRCSHRQESHAAQTAIHRRIQAPRHQALCRTFSPGKTLHVWWV